MLKLSSIAGLAALGFGVTAITAPAAAQSGPWLSMSQIESRLSAQGFRVLEIERDDGNYEVQAVARGGQCVELDVQRSTGDILRTQPDDDCGYADISAQATPQ